MHKLQPETALPQPPLYVGSEVFRRAAFGANHPLKIVRHSAVLDLVRTLGWLRDDDFRTPQPATVAQLTEFHDSRYVEALQYADSTGKVDPETRERYHIGTLENPLFEGLFERAATTTFAPATRRSRRPGIESYSVCSSKRRNSSTRTPTCFSNDPVRRVSWPSNELAPIDAPAAKGASSPAIACIVSGDAAPSITQQPASSSAARMATTARPDAGDAPP